MYIIVLFHVLKAFNKLLEGYKYIPALKLEYYVEWTKRCVVDGSEWSASPRVPFPSSPQLSVHMKNKHSKKMGL